MDKDQLNLTIRSREEVLYEGPIKSVSSVNKTGKFDILGKHANFITLIHDTLLIVEPDGKERQILVESAILKVTSNVINIYAGVGQLTPSSSNGN